MSFDTKVDFNQLTLNQWQFTTDKGNDDTGKKIDKSESSPFFKDSIDVGRGDPIFIGKLDYTNSVDFPKLWDPPNYVNSPEFRDLWGWAISGDLSKILSQSTEGETSIVENNSFFAGFGTNDSPDGLKESNSLAPLNEVQINSLSKEYGVSPEQIRGAYFFAQANPTVPLEEPMKTIVPQIQQQSTPMPGETEQFSQAFETVLDGASSDISALASQMGITIEQATQLLKDAAAMSTNPTTGSSPPAGPAMELFLKLESEAKAMVGAQKEGYAFERELDFGSTQITALAEQQGVDPADLKASLQSLQGLAQLAQKLDMPIADLRSLLASGDSGIQQVISLGEKVGLDPSTTQRAIDAIPSEALSEDIPTETDEMASHMVADANEFLNSPSPNASTLFLQFISPPADGSSGTITEGIQEKIASLASQLQISVEQCKELLITAQQNPTAQVPEPIRTLANEIGAQAEHSASMLEVVHTAEQSFEALLNSKDGPAANSIEQLSRLMRCSPEDVISKIRAIHSDPQAAPAGAIGARLSLLVTSLESQAVQYAVSTVQSKIDPGNVNVLIDNAYEERLDLAISNAGAEDVKFQIYFAIQNPELAETLDPKIVSLAQSIQATASSQISEKLGIPKEWASSSLPGGDIGSALYNRTVEDKLFELSLNGKITPEEMNQLQALHNMPEQSAPTTPRLAELLKKVENDALKQVREELGAPPNWEPKGDSTTFQTIVTQDYKSTVYANLKNKEKTEGIKLDHVLSSLLGSDIKLGPDDKKTLDDIKQQSRDEIESKYNLNVDKRDSSEGTDKGHKSAEGTDKGHKSAEGTDKGHKSAEGTEKDQKSAEGTEKDQKSAEGTEKDQKSSVDTEKSQKSSGRTSTGGQVTGVAVDIFKTPIATLSNARALQRADTMRLVLDGLSDAIDHLTRATTLNNVGGSGPVISSYSDYILVTRSALNLMKQVSQEAQAMDVHVNRMTREATYEKRMAEFVKQKTMIVERQEAIEKAAEAQQKAEEMANGMLALNIILCIFMVAISGPLFMVSGLVWIQIGVTVTSAPQIEQNSDKEKASKAFEGISIAASILMSIALFPVGGGAIGGLKAAAEAARTAAMALLRFLIQFAKTIVQESVVAALKMIAKVMMQVLQAAIEAVISAAKTVMEGLANLATQIVKTVSEIPLAVAKTVENLVEKGLFRWVKEGLEAMMQRVIDQAKAAVEAVVREAALKGEAISQAEQNNLLQMEISRSFAEMGFGAYTTITTLRDSVMRAVTQIYNARMLVAQAEVTESQGEFDAWKLLAKSVIDYMTSLADSMMDDMKKQGEKISKIAKDQSDFWTKLSGMLSRLYQV